MCFERMHHYLSFCVKKDLKPLKSKICFVLTSLGVKLLFKLVLDVFVLKLSITDILSSKIKKISRRNYEEKH